VSPDHITACAYNWNIDKRLARKSVWLHDTIYHSAHPEHSYESQELNVKFNFNRDRWCLLNTWSGYYQRNTVVVLLLLLFSRLWTTMVIVVQNSSIITSYIFVHIISHLLWCLYITSSMPVTWCFVWIPMIYKVKLWFIK